MIGNDIVDLSDRESSRDAHHARFDERVFTPEEMRWISADPSDLRRRWILWSAKEAAYKAARRESDEIVFAPAQFGVDLDRSLCGWVRHGERRWPVRIQIERDCVHAVVSEAESFAGVISGACRLARAAQGNPSGAVRQFAISSIAARLGVATSELRIEKIGRIPRLIRTPDASLMALSLSHHGSHVGFACCDTPSEKRAQTSPQIGARKAALVPTLPLDEYSHAGVAARSQSGRGDLR